VKEQPAEDTRIERLTYSIEEVAVMLGVSTRHAYTCARRAVFPVRRIGGRWVVPKAAFQEFLAGPSSEGSFDADSV
jgi:excisionase family DNA binding protein